MPSLVPLIHIQSRVERLDSIVPSFCFYFLTRSTLAALFLLDLDQYLMYFGNCLGVRVELTPKKAKKRRQRWEIYRPKDRS